MTEEITVKPKQYLLLVDGTLVSTLGAIFPSLRFLEIEGREASNDPGYSVLVNPKAKNEE